MKLDKDNPTGYDGYIVNRVVKDKTWAKRLKGQKKDALKSRH